MIDDEIQRALADIVGLRAWGPEISFGSFLALNFGRTRIDPIGSPIGEYFLGIYGAHWAIWADPLIVATSDDERPTMESAAARLDGATLTVAEFDQVNFRLSLEFGGNLAVQIRPIDDPDIEQWELFLPDDTVILAGPLRRLRHVAAHPDHPHSP
ncbi:MAG: hypothetical protein KQH57_06805 [Actinomycetales bacterium]|nr:hypothetical protein [Actinomycetales bacterium]